MSNALLRRNSSKQGLQNLMRYVVSAAGFCLFLLDETGEREAAGVNI